MKRRLWLVIFSIFQLGLLTMLTLWVHKHPQPAAGIRHIQRFQRKRSRLAHHTTTVVGWIIGEAIWINVLALPTALLLWSKRLRLEALMTLGTIWGGGLLRAIMESLLRRPRPSSALLPMSGHKKSKSFPSGHVSMATIFWGWLLSLSILHPQISRSWCKWQSGLTALFLALVGPSRIYLGDHWGTDVVGGYLFGGSWLCLSVPCYLALREKNELMVSINK